MKAASLRMTGARLAGGLCAAGLAGCGSLTLGGGPQELTVRVEAVGTSSIAVVTSTRFVFVQDPECDQTQGENCQESLKVLAADTSSAAVPFERTYTFTSSRMYLVEVFPAAEEPATLWLRVEIDGKEWFNQSRAVQPRGVDGARESILFAYTYTEPVL